jgi:hypothetical protein
VHFSRPAISTITDGELTGSLSTSSLLYCDDTVIT